MSTSNIFQRQIENRNFLSPTGFKFVLNKAPKVAFFSNFAMIPGMTLGTAVQPTYLKDIDLPGDKILFDDFTLRFIVDEDLKNYLEIQNWLRGIGFPESLKEIQDLQKKKEFVDADPGTFRNIFSDGTLTVLTSSQNPNFLVKFSDLWPYNLTTLNFDATDADIQYFTAEVSFKYTIYNITDLSGKKL